MVYLSAVYLLVFVPLTYCSSGDRSGEFSSCVYSCRRSMCAGEGGGDLSLVLRALGWTCGEECQYQCMHNITTEDLRNHRPVRQFYGKWPFVRVLGVQEPASALFSVLNALGLVVGYTRFRRLSPSTYPYHSILGLQLIVCLHTWFWSTVFHSRDTYWTERLDYFSAASMIVAGILAQFVRLTGLKHWRWHLCYAGLWLVLFSCHVGYLTMFKFDYGYNMAASVLAGVLYAVVWLIWCIKVYQQRPYVWKCLACVLAASCFLALELLDFPPLLWIIDAHSLWHLSTAPLPLLWYSFLTDDAHYEVAVQLAKQV